MPKWLGGIFGNTVSSTADNTEITGVFNSSGQYYMKREGGWSYVTCSISPSTTSVNEGSSVTFTISTTNVPDSTTLYWTLNAISGTINSSDFSGGATSGSFTVTSNSGSVVLTLANDLTTEGSESFQFQVRTGSTSGTIIGTSSTITIGDTSLTPPAEFEMFLLAGGGGGGATPAGYAGGGGGSGGAVYFSSYVIPSPTTLAITVGGGGSGGGTSGGTGTPSTVTDPTGPYLITANGGGGGVGYPPYRVGNPGGSGGGSESPAGDVPGAPGTQGSVTGSPAESSAYVLYGQPGGPITPVNGGCSGGGGLGAAGSTPVLGEATPNPEKYRGAPGGIGITLPQFQGPDIGINPLSPYSGRYGGGGGAGTVGTDPTVYGGNSPSNPLPGNASPYGGGVGGKYGSPGVAGTPGAQYLGGGGGGGAPYQAPGGQSGGAGGAGICIIRFATDSPLSGSASGAMLTPPVGLSPGNGYVYFTFNGSGTLSLTK